MPVGNGIEGAGVEADARHGIGIGDLPGPWNARLIRTILKTYPVGLLCVVIFANDHEPAHVHVFGDGETKIDLGAPGGRPRLLWADGMTKADVRRAMEIVTEAQALLLERWREIHGPID